MLPTLHVGRLPLLRHLSAASIFGRCGPIAPQFLRVSPAVVDGALSRVGHGKVTGFTYFHQERGQRSPSPLRCPHAPAIALLFHTRQNALGTRYSCSFFRCVATESYSRSMRSRGLQSSAESLFRIMLTTGVLDAIDLASLTPPLSRLVNARNALRRASWSKLTRDVTSYTSKCGTRRSAYK